MAKTTPIQTNFTAGEWSPKLDGRVDVSRYPNAVSIIENFIVEPFGGADRRPGSVFVAPAKFPDKKVRLIPFEFSTIQTYMIEAGELYFRFYRNNAAITELALTITGATQADPVNLTIVAHGLVVDDEFIVQGVVGMTELNNKRFRVNTVPGVDNITIKDLDGVTVDGTGFNAYISGGTASQIFEIASPYLESQLADIQFAQTADLMYLVHQDVQTQKLIRSSDTDWTLTAVDFVGGPFQPTNDDETLTVSITGTVKDATETLTSTSPIFNANQVGGLFRLGVLVSSVQGYVEITVFNNSSSVDVLIRETISGTGPFDDWAFGSFSDDAGHAQAVGFAEQRLFLGGTLFNPQTIDGSKTNEFENFTAGANDADALQYEIVSEKVNAIRWISTGRGLAIGTSGGVFILSSGADFLPLTPINLTVRRETNFGSELVTPKRIGNFVYYIQRGKRKLREFAYNFDIDAHRSLDMTLLSEQISESGFIELDYQQSPDSVLWAVRADGEIATMTRQQDQEVIAWSRQVSAPTLAGPSLYESLGVIPTGGEEDEVWVSVRREVNSVVRRFIEFFPSFNFEPINNEFYVDSGLSFVGSPTTVLTGLDHLEGESVVILNEGAVEPARTVVNGQITLDNETTRAHVGLNYTSDIKSVILEGGSVLGTTQGKVVRINEITFRFHNTLGGRFGFESGTNQIFFRNTNDPMDTSVPIFTGDVRETFPSDYTRRPRWFIQQDQPLPMNILAVMPLYEVFEQ